MGGGASVAALACGDDSSATGTGPGATTGGNAGGGNTGGANSGGDGAGNEGGAGTGGANAGGANAGGANAGGANAGGNGAGGAASACGAALIVKGSNYATDPHDVTIPLVDLEAGVTKTYESTGNSHQHNLTITAADFEALRNGETVKKYTCFANPSSTDHEWVISCADPSIMPTFEGEFGTPGDCPST